MNNMNKLKLIDKLKMHKHAMALGVSIIMIACSFAYIFAMQDNNTFYLQDLEGDRDALSDLVITGYLQDKYHGQKFRLDKGNLAHEFIYYDRKDDMHMSPAIYVNGTADDEYMYNYSYSYEIADDANTRTEYTENKIQLPLENGSSLEATEKITRTYADKIDVYMYINKNWLPGERRKEAFPAKNRLKFKTGVSLARDNMDFVFESKEILYLGGGSSEQPALFRSPDLVSPFSGMGYALAALDGKQYFTVVNQGNKQTGENGIFTAVEYVDDIDVLTRNDHGKVKKLVSFDLGKENIQMLGLHAVENSLVAVMLADDILTFRVYDPQDGRLLAELAVPEFDVHGQGKGLSENQDAAAAASGDESWIQYIPHIYENTLSLNITRLNRENYQNGIIISPRYLNIVSVKITDENDENNENNESKHGGSIKIDLLHCIKDYKLNNQVVTNVPAVVPVNNKLVVFAVLRDKQTNEAPSPTPAKISQINEFLYPVHFNIFIFDGIENSCRLLYAGEIVTDADDDGKGYRQAFKNYYWNDDSYQAGTLYSGYDYYENRNIGLITIRGY
ncbi:MAG: hypothetical protein GX754_02970 [Clostridiaceae bacterium]|nr:hypothetical protein [Clostridiaceae bacterium]